MNRDEFHGASFNQLVPFGVELIAADSASLRSIRVDSLRRLVAEHRIVVARGFAPLIDLEFPEFCRGFGELQEWDFGVVNNLHVNPESKNYLYTNRAVPFHWDGAFVRQVPHYIIFHCDAAPTDGGGETLFCDTDRLLNAAPGELVEKWRRIAITYTTEKVVHYGGTFTSLLITPNPENGSEVLRFAEPVLDLNPVQLKINGLAGGSEGGFLTDLHERLRDETVCYAHAWRSGDVVIADNYILLHGRREFASSDKRRIRRVNVL